MSSLRASSKDLRIIASAGVAEIQLRELIESVLEHADQVLHAEEAERDRTHFDNGRKFVGVDNHRLQKEAALV